MSIASNIFLLVAIFSVITAAFAIPVIITFAKDEILPHSKKPKLDVIGIITNIILGILYIPLSLAGSLIGMVSEGYMYDPTWLQSLLCDTIMILGIFTPLVCIAGIVTSVLFRIRSRSVASFWVQFSGVLYIAFTLLLILILELT